MRVVKLTRHLAWGCLYWFGIQSSFADGIIFVNGRYPASEGRIIELQLTNEQVKVIELVRKCRLPNTFTPYVFKLTSAQALAVKSRVGFVPSRFANVEGFIKEKNGDARFDGDELKMNVINRFAVDKFEILETTLTQDRDATNWETNVMGWKPSPFNRSNAQQIRAGKCPK